MVSAVSPQPVDAHLPGPPVTFVRGEGSALWDADGKRYLDFLVGLAVTSLGHAHPAVADAVRRAGPHAAARVEPLRHRPSARRWPPPSTGSRRGVGARSSSATPAPRPTSARSSSPASGAARAATSSSAPTARSTGARSPRCTPPASPQKHEAFQPLPEGFRHVAWDDLDALDAALDADAWPPCCSSRCRARAACNPATPEYFQGVRRLCDERGLPAHRRRGADRARPHGASGSASSTSASSPTSSPWPRRSATACPIGACWARRRRRRRLRARRPRHDLRRPAAGHRGGAGGARRSCRREDVPGRAADGRARDSPRRSRSIPAVAGVRGLGLLLAAELRRPARRREVVARCPRSRPGRQRGDAEPRCGSRRRCSSPTTRSTRRSPSCDGPVELA